MFTRELNVPKSTKEQLNDILEDSISSLKVSQRTVNSLERQGVLTIRDLMNCCNQEPSECEKHCRCQELFTIGSREHKKWVPKCYLKEIPGFAEITIERILIAVKQRLAQIH